MDRDKLNTGFKSGCRKGWSGFLWVMKILVPVSLLTTLLGWSGLLPRIEFILRPAMNLVSLPAAAALPLVISFFGGIYAGIGAMTALDLTREQMTLIAIFMMIAHNLVQEGAIQGRSGLHPLKATLFRLAAAVVTVMIVARLLGVSASEVTAPAASASVATPLLPVLQKWLLSTLTFAAKLFLIMMAILILMEIMKAMGWIHPIVDFLSPLLKLMGLSRRVGLLWVTGAVFGLSYGAAVIVEEVKEGHLTKEEIETLHLSIGINHSVIEDPAVFMTLGLNFFWVWFPRLFAAILAVRILSFWSRRSRKAV
jgi:spore maturation protein SpmB